MAELAELAIGVVLLCLLGVLLDAARAPRWAGGIPIAAAGVVTGFVATLALVLAVWPGACVAVLCPTCYREPPTDAVWRATLILLTLVGITIVALPGLRFRVGLAIGSAPGVLEAASDGMRVGAGSAVLLAVAVTLSLWAVRHEIASHAPRPQEVAASASWFWDGDHWTHGSQDAGRVG